MIRAYVPTTLRGLAQVAASSQVAVPVAAHAVTEAVRAEWVEHSEEEWEYEALCLAADDCADLWTPQDVRRRVVLAVDVDDDDARRADDPGALSPVETPDPTVVLLHRAVPLARVAAVHADLTEADAERGEDLCWFATQELEDLLEGPA